MDLSEDKYKLALATDLIIFLTYLWTYGQENQVALIEDMLNKWSQKIEGGVALAKEEFAKQMVSEEGGITKDVASIILEATNTPNKIIKGEFKSQMREAITKGIAQYNKL